MGSAVGVSVPDLCGWSGAAEGKDSSASESAECFESALEAEPEPDTELESESSSEFEEVESESSESRILGVSGDLAKHINRTPPRDSDGSYRLGNSNR